MRLPNWNLTFTAKRRLQRAGLITAIVVMLLILIWFCWVIWAERYVVYSREGATINLDLPERIGGGQVGKPDGEGIGGIGRGSFGEVKHGAHHE